MPWHIERDHVGCPAEEPWAVVKDEDGSVAGCHATEAEALDQMAALYASEQGASMADEITVLPERWSGVLAVEGSMTDDGRMFDPGALGTRPLPLPLMWQPENGMGHDGAVIVGNITRTWRDGAFFMGEGTFDLNGEQGREAARLVGEGYLKGVSIDVAVDGADVTIVEDEVTWTEIYHAGLVMGATLLPLPAFAEAVIKALGVGDTLAVTGQADLPIAGRDLGWDGAAAAGRVFDSCTSGDTLDVACASRAFFWRDPDMDDTNRTAYKFGFADIVDGQLQAIPKGIFAVAAVLGGGRGGSTIPQADQDQIRSRLNNYYSRMADEFDDPTITPPWEGSMSSTTRSFQVDPPSLEVTVDEQSVSPPAEIQAAFDALVAAATAAYPDNEYTVSAEIDVVTATPAPAPDAAPAGLLAAGGPVHPPRQWFDDPVLVGPTPLQVTDEGRVFGHLATWDTCHIGLAQNGQCITAPRSSSNYSYFLTGDVLTAEGHHVPTGRLTVGASHAALRSQSGQALGWRPAAQHYDNTGWAAADIAVGEDDWGIWCSGAVRPDVTEEQLREFRASPPSGDWRKIGSGLELVGVLSVNVPGFPVPRAEAVVASGEPQVLVASIPPDPSKLTSRQLDAIAERVASTIGRDRKSRAAGLAARMGR